MPSEERLAPQINMRDAWFIGFSPDLVVGVVVDLIISKSLGKMQAGGVVAAPIFQEFMQEVLQGTPAIPFRVPTGVKFHACHCRKTGKPCRKMIRRPC